MLSPLMLHYNCGGVAIVLLKKSRHLPLLLKNHHDISLINILSWYGLVYIINNRQIYYYIFINSIPGKNKLSTELWDHKNLSWAFHKHENNTRTQSIRSKHYLPSLAEMGCRLTSYGIYMNSEESDSLFFPSPSFSFSFLNFPLFFSFLYIFFNFIFQYLLNFDLVFINYFGLLLMTLPQS